LFGPQWRPSRRCFIAASAATTVPSPYVSKDAKNPTGVSVAFPVVAVRSALEIEHVSCEDQITETTPNVVEVHSTYSNPHC